MAARRGKNPELLRSVLAEEVWNHYARFLLTVSAVAPGRQLMASAQATTRLASAGAASRTHASGCVPVPDLRRPGRPSRPRAAAATAIPTSRPAQRDGLVTQVATTMRGAPKIASHPGSAAASAGTPLQPPR